MKSEDRLAKEKQAQEILKSVCLCGIEAKFEEVKGKKSCGCESLENVVNFYKDGKIVGTLEYLKDPANVKYLDEVFQPYAVKIHKAYQKKEGGVGCC